jgi:hypothetical protein
MGLDHKLTPGVYILENNNPPGGREGEKYHLMSFGGKFEKAKRKRGKM